MPAKSAKWRWSRTCDRLYPPQSSFNSVTKWTMWYIWKLKMLYRTVNSHLLPSPNNHDVDRVGVVVWGGRGVDRVKRSPLMIPDILSYLWQWSWCIRSSSQHSSHTRTHNETSGRLERSLRWLGSMGLPPFIHLSHPPQKVSGNSVSSWARVTRGEARGMCVPDSTRPVVCCHHTSLWWSALNESDATGEITGTRPNDAWAPRQLFVCSHACTRVCVLVCLFVR